MPHSKDKHERRPAMEVMVEIHSRVDMDLVQKLTDVLKAETEAKGPLKNSVVSACFAYMLGDSISQNCEQDEICLIAETYYNYFHNIAHTIKAADDFTDGLPASVNVAIIDLRNKPKPH